MISEDIIEGPADIEEPGTFLSNLVITDKNGTDKVWVTLDCQEVNKSIYSTHEPFPQWRNYDMNSKVVTDFHHSISQIVSISLR